MQKTIVGLVICCWSLWVTQAVAQPTLLHIQPVFMQQPIALNTTVHNAQGDSLSVTMLRFYLGHFKFLNKGRTVLEDNTYHLLDLEEENTLKIPFQLPQNTFFDSLQFDLGVDSLTNVSGAIGGDLDPTKGMYWAWQSGYVNFKLEGKSPMCPTRKHEFQFHLGGYLAPNYALQTIDCQLDKPISNPIRFQLNIQDFLSHIDLKQQNSVMIPSEEAVLLAQKIAQLFRFKSSD